MTVHDKEIKDQLENAILEVLESPEYKNKKIDCLQLTIVESSRSSVVLHLRSDGRDVKLLVEKAIVNGDLTRFIGHIVDNKNIKIYMSPERKYEISVSLCSKEENVKNYTGMTYSICSHFILSTHVFSLVFLVTLIYLSIDLLILNNCILLLPK